MRTYSAPHTSASNRKVSSLFSLSNGFSKSSASHHSFHYKRSYDEMDGKAKVTLVEQEVLANTSQWQDSSNDMPQRRLILQQIMALAQPQNGINPNSSTERERREYLITLAKRIELSLYSRAASLEEYQNLSTLRRRLQALISFSYHETAAITEQALLERVLTKQNVFKPRKAPLIKVKRHCALPSRSKENECIFRRLDEDSARTIFSFLDGKEIIRVRGVNKYASKFLPTCVTSLRVHVRSMAQSFTNGQSAFGAILTLVNLRRLVIYKGNDPTLLDAQANSRALRAWSCTELDASEDNIGEKVTHSLASAIEFGACERLNTLQLVALFTNTFHRNGLRALCGVLALGKCPELTDLLLGGNSIGDVGSLYIARVLHSNAILKLQRLDLRRNYIGELGIKRLMSVVSARAPLQLKYLCLGGNIITDNCVSAFTSVLSTSACPHLRFLGLEDNYLSPEGVQTIIRSAVKSGMIPRLYKVGNENSKLQA
uniref:Uncharacterized protein AlNc14C373G11124 n=1 Tax=Albugo laibachii Nc14 TaxID=890382 RepID=F0WY64_9STRA|nr:conserved hypothetical protein [Albugo laibachii Nc14]|eukprot:CCA26416.1 conserved hypothetical protein [Albugo laibachii Nc14]